MNELMTIGYEKASMDALLATLKEAGVQVLIDVREAPYSKKPGFSKKPLSESVLGAGIQYIHLVDLGNPKPAREAAKRGEIGRYQEMYRAHLAGEAGQAALAKTIDFAFSSRVCLMCYERDPAFCHRSIIVEAILAKATFTIRHLKVPLPEPVPQMDLFNQN